MFKLAAFLIILTGLTACKFIDKGNTKNLGFTENKELNTRLVEADENGNLFRMQRITSFSNTSSVSGNEVGNFYTFQHSELSRFVAVSIEAESSIELIVYEDGNLIGTKSSSVYADKQLFSLYIHAKQGSEYTILVSNSLPLYLTYNIEFYVFNLDESIPLDEFNKRIFEEVTLSSLLDKELTYINYQYSYDTKTCHQRGYLNSGEADEVVNGSSALEWQYGSCKDRFGVDLIGVCSPVESQDFTSHSFFLGINNEDYGDNYCNHWGESYLKVTH